MTTNFRPPGAPAVPAVAPPQRALSRLFVAPPEDERVIELWLDGRPHSTRKEYAYAVACFYDGTGGKPLRAVTLDDLQAHASSLAGLAPNTRKKRLAAIKSLFSFASGKGIGYLPLDPARALRLPKAPDRLAERILDEEAVAEMVAAEPVALRRLMLRLFYVSGGRISEVVKLSWQDCHARRDFGVITFTGENAKGGVSRTVKLTPALWRELMAFRPPGGSGFVFPSPRRPDDSPVDVATAWRWFKAAALRIGMVLPSPHWFRHAHASHSLDRGAPVQLVAATLGHKSLATTTRYAHARPDASSGDYLALDGND